MSAESGVFIPEDSLFCCNRTLGGFFVCVCLTFSEFTQTGPVGKDANFGEEMITAVFISVPHQQTFNCSFQVPGVLCLLHRGDDS